ncbi:hypothetical protein [Neisseria dumasiana]|uniref:Lipoprotein signal peptidase n=1 Tax=Neisseria dumasiana TaxID=1931275 RepID=A0ABX3WQ02_9NEIS|nr:hypothetical protein [Neisseria dumasiana]OSI36515.1 hypothetical protein BV913_01535 [Neisseria dumasiana]UOO83966.1 hypothetical protein LVJ88_09805 [Neisseria dumasiana]
MTILRSSQNHHLRRISALCAARSFACLYDMSAPAVLLRLELHPHTRAKVSYYINVCLLKHWKRVMALIKK